MFVLPYLRRLGLVLGTRLMQVWRMPGRIIGICGIMWWKLVLQESLTFGWMYFSLRCLTIIGKQLELEQNFRFLYPNMQACLTPSELKSSFFYIGVENTPVSASWLGCDFVPFGSILYDLF